MKLKPITICLILFAFSFASADLSGQDLSVTDTFENSQSGIRIPMSGDGTFQLIGPALDLDITIAEVDHTSSYHSPCQGSAYGSAEMTFFGVGEIAAAQVVLPLSGTASYSWEDGVSTEVTTIYLGGMTFNSDTYPTITTPSNNFAEVSTAQGSIKSWTGQGGFSTGGEGTLTFQRTVDSVIDWVYDNPIATDPDVRNINIEFDVTGQSMFSHERVFGDACDEGGLGWGDPFCHIYVGENGQNLCPVIQQ
jgi:hypothetical protein